MFARIWLTGYLIIKKLREHPCKNWSFNKGLITGDIGLEKGTGKASILKSSLNLAVFAVLRIIYMIFFLLFF